MEFELRDYLERIFPALLGGSTLPPPKPLLVLQLVLSDRDDCDIHYRITDRGVEARLGISDRVDLTVALVSADLAAFSRGELDVGRAVQSARIEAIGDRSILTWLARRLEVA